MSAMADNSTSRIARMFGGLLPSKGSDDDGRGKLEDYDYNLRPKKSDTVIRLAESNPHQDELRSALELGAESYWAMISRRGPEEERTDAPMPVRIFAGGRVSGIVGLVPRGLEAPVDDALARLLTSGKPPRIPVSIVQTRGGLRVDLDMGATR